MVSIDLSGKVAIVTGASRGLGAEIALLLAKAGAQIVLNYHTNRAAAERVAADIDQCGGDVLLFQGDISDESVVNNLVATTHSVLGPVGIVINNVGREERRAGPFELAWADYQHMIDLNLKAAYFLVRACLPDMQAAHWGRVVNIGSRVLNKGMTGGSAYVSAKGAMLGMTRNWAFELGRYGVTVNLVAPSWIPVERHAGTEPKSLEQLAQDTPMQRIGTAKDVAGVVLFCCSELAGFVTGATLPVTGGATGFSGT